MTRDELLASLQVTDSAEGYYLDGGRYFDWSVARCGGGVEMEIGDGADTVQVELDADEIAELHKRLTVWLLNR